MIAVALAAVVLWVLANADELPPPPPPAPAAPEPPEPEVPAWVRRALGVRSPSEALLRH